MADKPEPKGSYDPKDEHVDIKYDEKAQEAKRRAELKASAKEFEERQKQAGQS